MKTAGFCVLAMALGLAGCVAHGRQPTYGSSKFQVIVAADTIIGEPRAALSEKDVQAEVDRLLALSPSVPVPSKVLLFEVASSGQSDIKSAHTMLTLRKETGEMMKAALEKTGLFARVDFLPEIYLPGDERVGLKTLRIAAARAHADGLLLYSTETGYDYSPNGLCIFYPTIIGAFIVPGSRGSSMAVSKAVLVDVKTGYIYRVFESYGEATAVRPVALLDEEQLEFDARREALEALADLVADKAKELAGARK